MDLKVSFAHILITRIETKTLVVSDQLKELQAVKCAVMCLTFFKCSIEEMISDSKLQLVDILVISFVELWSKM